MIRSVRASLFVLVLLAACAREAPSVSHRPPATPSVELDAGAAFLTVARATFARLATLDPPARERELGALAATPVPVSLPSEVRATLAIEIDRELALAAFDAGRGTEAVVAIERALSTAEAMPRRDAAFVAGLLLTAEVVYERAGRSEAARWAHGEARALLISGADP